MGKVIVNTTDATKTARNGSQETEAHRETVRANDNAHRQDRERPDVTRAKTRVLPAGQSMNNNTQRSGGRTISKFRQLPAGNTNTDHIKDVAIVKASNRNGATITEKTTNVKNNSAPAHKIDPELALMANRSASAERGKINNAAHQNGTSMSGMVREKHHANIETHANLNDKLSKTLAKTAAEKSSEAELRFTKLKSTLIGVGVALLVAVVGFAGIAIFGNNKKICVVNFESNGGSDVDGAEVVCGRTVSQPADPVKDGFDFEGWIYDGDPFDFNSGIYRNATLVARWSVKEGTDIVTVKFDTDGGTKINDVQLARGRTLSPPTAPRKIGYVLSNWYLGDQVFDFSTPITEDITLKAQWVRATAPVNPDNNTARPNNDRVTSINLGDFSIKVGETSSVVIGIVPSTAVYELTAISSDEGIVSCNVSDKQLNCTARQAGTATVTVKDNISGQSRMVTVTVEPVADQPDNNDDPNNNTDPDPNNPDNPDDPNQGGNGDNNNGDNDNNNNEDDDNKKPGEGGNNNESGGGDDQKDDANKPGDQNNSSDGGGNANS